MDTSCRCENGDWIPVIGRRHEVPLLEVTAYHAAKEHKEERSRSGFRNDQVREEKRKKEADRPALSDPASPPPILTERD
ncbi:hypothetical protein GBF38_004383 [Nibea albiflora]|uniref:Uncharacterized protein n=1 Tax=Nibea albiflora TaxID=240163 RepID=A0ACB7FG05_NIBAL|nr:hypothetical protein GBF38_004383 [Nibea albiflora]